MANNRKNFEGSRDRVRRTREKREEIDSKTGWKKTRHFDRFVLHKATWKIRASWETHINDSRRRRRDCVDSDTRLFSPRDGLTTSTWSSRRSFSRDFVLHLHRRRNSERVRSSQAQSYIQGNMTTRRRATFWRESGGRNNKTRTSRRTRPDWRGDVATPRVVTHTRGFE